MREFVNYRHPGPRRVWKVGSELQSTTLDPVDPVNCRLCPKVWFRKSETILCTLGPVPRGTLTLGGRNEAPAGILAGNPDFLGEKKLLRACWQEIRTFFGDKKAPAGMAPGNPDFSWWGIRSGDHFNRSGKI